MGSVDVFARHPHTKFVVVAPDPSVGGPLVESVSNNRNAADLFSIEGPGAYLAGYLSALMAEKSPGKLPPGLHGWELLPHGPERDKRLHVRCDGRRSRHQGR